jgi:pimeloyl-ACP methyl ester carboxylesterase
MNTDLQTAQLVNILSTDGTPIGLWKTGSGPAVLAVHGTAADHSAWDAVVPLLADSFTVYAMDRRGRGASGDAADYSIEREFNDVAAAVDALPGPVHLYGHSFGGTCAAEAALRLRNLGSLILYEGGPKPSGFRFIPDDFIAQLELMIESGDREDAVATFMVKVAGVAPHELDGLRHSPAWPARLAAAHTIPRELRAINDYGAEMDSFAGINFPVLLLAGSETEARRRAMATALTRVLPNSRVTELPGQRHSAHQAAPAQFASVIRDFLGADAGPGPAAE